jgi:primary-amine oxidase
VAIHAPDVRTTTSNPLEPLSADEIRRTSEILREQRDLGDQVRFVMIRLQEPPKKDVLEHDRTGGPEPERAAPPSSTTGDTSRPSRRSSR